MGEIIIIGIFALIICWNIDRSSYAEGYKDGFIDGTNSSRGINRKDEFYDEE